MSRAAPFVSAGLALALCACASQPAAPPPKAAAAPLPDAAATPFGLFLAGRAAFDEGHMNSAADYLSRASALEGDPAYLKGRAFSAALMAGDVPAAAALAPPVDPSEDDTDVLAQQRLGVLVKGVEAMAEGKYKDAYALLSGPGIGYPHRTAAVLVSVWAAAGAGDAASATQTPALGADPVAQFIGALNQAELEARFDKTAAAEASFKGLMAAGDAGGLVSAAYGGFLERHGRWKEAGALYQAELARSPGDPLFTAAAARAVRRGPASPAPGVREGAARSLLIPAAGLIAQKQNDVALEYLRLALRLDPDDDEAWVLLGDLLSAAGDEEGARDAYGRPKPGSPRFISARGKLEWSYENDSAGDTALKLARDTAAQAPADRDAIITLAELLRDNDDYQEAAATLTRLIAAPGAQPDWRLYYLRAAAYDGAGDWPREEADLQAALKIKPDDPDLLNYLAYAWIDRGEHLQEALVMAQKAVDAEPQSGAILDSLGWGYYRLGDFKTAAAKLETAVALEPADADVNNHLGDAYWRVGRKVEAQFQWRRVLTLEPDDALKAQVAAKLASPLGPDAPVPPPAPPPVAAPPAAPATPVAPAKAS